MENEIASTLLVQLSEATRVLSLDSGAKESYLKTDGTWPLLDELALQLDDALVPLIDNSALNDAQNCAFGELSLALDRISGPSNAELWDGDNGALDRPEWQQIRTAAAAALATIPKTPASA